MEAISITVIAMIEAKAEAVIGISITQKYILYYLLIKSQMLLIQAL
jgi:hypothetical protein